MLEACRQHKVEHLLYASSSSVYGANAKTPFSESDQTDEPVSLYAATKKANELMAHTYSHLYGMPITGLRFFTVYGPWGRPDMAYFSFARKMLAREKIPVFAEGKLYRDFTYIDDIVEGVVRLLFKPSIRKASRRIRSSTSATTSRCRCWISSARWKMRSASRPSWTSSRCSRGMCRPRMPTRASCRSGSVTSRRRRWRRGWRSLRSGIGRRVAKAHLI
jgi:hypothetical protein